MIRNNIPMQGGVMKNILHSFVLFIVVTVASAVFTYPAHAGRYELIKGKGVEVCKAYEKSLNSFHYFLPMTCEREVDTEVREFSKPKWQKVDAIKNFSLARTVDEFLQPELYGRTTEGSLATLKQRAQNEGILMSLSDIDINNDGNTESVLKFNYGPCAPPGSGGWWATPILVLNEKRNSIDLEKSAHLLQNESTDKERYPAGGWRYTMYDIFLYREKAYFDRWSDFLSETGTLHVFVTEKSKTKEICTYKFQYPSN